MKKTLLKKITKLINKNWNKLCAHTGKQRDKGKILIRWTIRKR